jgi:eukaryotic-like serine/threonine-protein kinase
LPGETVAETVAVGSRGWPGAALGDSLEVPQSDHGCLTETFDRLKAALADRYTLERELGRGGMATVYLAKDLKHDRPVALKVLHPELGATLGPERFLREIRLTARLEHPHILPVLDSGESAGLLWYTMPYVRGESLRDRLSREVQLPVELALDLTRQVASALDYAHREGVVHRDLKPENILVAGGQARVADFGIAKAVAGGGESTLTDTGLAVGTPAYMSPEQASGSPVDARTDVYALGCVLYEMLAGEPPYTGRTPQAVLAKRLSEPVPHVRTLRDSVPKAVEQALTQALAKVPADRFPTIALFAGALNETPATEAVAVVPSTMSVKRSAGAGFWPRPRLVAFGLVALLGLSAVTALFWRSREAPRALEADLLAVVPFDVLQPNLGLWREGLVDLLARNLDGAGPLRTVSPTLVVRRWEGRADRTSATSLARSVGAGIALYGTLVGTGPDSVRLTASVLDVTRGEMIGEAEFRGTADRIDQLADSLTIRVLRELARDRPIAAARSSGLGSRSLPALRYFLRGEQLFRRTEWDSARASYEQATTLDSTFALAYRRLGTIAGWQYGVDSRARAFIGRAAALNHGLPPRESLLLVCDSLFNALDEGALRDSAGRANLEHLFSASERVAARYPTDPEAWEALGEARFHFGAGLGVSDAMTLEAFERAIRLDSAYAPAYIHAVSLALALNEHSTARHYLARYLDLRPGGDHALANQLTSLLLDTKTAPAEVERVLDTVPPSALFSAWLNFASAPDSAEIAIRLARRLAARRVSDETFWRDPVFRLGVVAVSLGFRGHLREASSVVAAEPQLRGWFLFPELALARAIPAETADVFYKRRLSREPFRSPPNPLEPFEEGLLNGPYWWAARGDTASLKRYVERMNRLAGSNKSSPASADPYWLAAGEAYFALARRDTVAALKRFAALPDSTGPVWFERLTLARLLAAKAQERQALSILDREFPNNSGWVGVSRGIWALERARLAEKLGEHEKAKQWYTYVAAVWQHADAELQPFLAEAREALGRLTAEPRQ